MTHDVESAGGALRRNSVWFVGVLGTLVLLSGMAPAMGAHEEGAGSAFVDVPTSVQQRTLSCE